MTISAPKTRTSIITSFEGYGPMSPHPGYGMTTVASDYTSNPYTPYPTSGYSCAGGYPGTVTTGYPVPPGGYSPSACYSMPPPQHSLPQHDKPPNKDRLVIVKVCLIEHSPMHSAKNKLLFA